jgi:hypothetical protein
MSNKWRCLIQILYLLRRTIFYISAAFCFFIISHSAFADDKPQICNSSTGAVWYFAINQTVFLIRNPTYLTDVDITDAPPALTLKAPNPASRLGCKDNPQQLLRFSALGAVIGVKGLTGSIGRYPINPDISPSIDPYLIGLQSNLLNCMNKKFITRSVNGSLLCQNGTGSLNPLDHPNEKSEWELRISGNRYRTPLGDMLVASTGIAGIEIYSRLSFDSLLD